MSTIHVCEVADPAIRRVLEADSRFRSVKVRRWDWNQTYTASKYRQLMLSYSGTPILNEPDRSGLVDDVEIIVREQFDDSVTRPLVVTLTSARLT